MLPWRYCHAHHLAQQGDRGADPRTRQAPRRRPLRDHLSSGGRGQATRRASLGGGKRAPAPAHSGTPRLDPSTDRRGQARGLSGYGRHVRRERLAEMMVIDSSAFFAIHEAEPEREAFEQALVGARGLAIGAPVYLETVMVLSRHGGARRWFDAYIAGYDIRIVPVDETVARLAADAFERYGRGRGHVARLNFGDCLSYAVAKSLDAPLLFKGDDFRLTDVAAAL